MARKIKEDVVAEQPTDAKDVKTPEEQLKKFLKEHEESHFNFEQEVDYKISTSSLNLDIELGGGLGPGFHRLVGHNNSGKTPSSLEIQSNFLKYHQQLGNKARGVLVRSEGRLSKENMERTGVKYVFSAEEWKDGTVFIFNCQKYEIVAKFIASLIRDNPTKTLYNIIIDSMDGLKVGADEGKGFDENVKVAGAPLLSKRFLSDLSLEINVKGHQCLCISQVTADIKLDPYAKTAPKDGAFSGGNAISHFANWTLEFNKFYASDLILDKKDGKVNDGKSKILGHWCKLTIRKSTNEKNYVNVEYPIKHHVQGKSAVWVEYELIDQLLAWDMVSAKGAWIETSQILLKELRENKIPFQEQFNGKEKLKSFLEENPITTSYLFEKFKTTLSGLNNKGPK